MKKVYVKPGETVTIKVKDCLSTQQAGIANTVQMIHILDKGDPSFSFWGEVAGIMYKKKPVTLLLVQLGFFYDPQGIYYLTEPQTKM